MTVKEVSRHTVKILYFRHWYDQTQGAPFPNWRWSEYYPQLDRNLSIVTFELGCEGSDFSFQRTEFYLDGNEYPLNFHQLSTGLEDSVVTVSYQDGPWCDVVLYTDMKTEKRKQIGISHPKDLSADQPK